MNPEKQRDTLAAAINYCLDSDLLGDTAKRKLRDAIVEAELRAGYTDGPWELVWRDDDGTYPWPIVRIAPKRQIEMCGRSYQEAVANAKLVVRAPELVQHLGFLVLHLKADERIEQRHIDRAGQIVREALGRE